ncbi:transposase [Thiolapillus sp.]|uniref:transposase n=1 Tax=Thiolapillus sp. TaxID=2017437 RepID=UPI003AF55784
MKKVAKTIKEHLWGILNAIVLKVSNGPAEGLNSRIKMGSSAEFVGSRGGFEANDQVSPVGVEPPTRSLRRWSCETIINSEGTKWDAAQDYPEPGAEIQVICLQVGALGW